MIIVKVNQILDKEERNIRWLSEKCGTNYSVMYNFCMNKTQSVNYEMLDKVCDVLHCKISDVLEKTKENNTNK